VGIELEGERLVGFENLTRTVLRLSRYFGRPRDSARSQEVGPNEPRSVWRGSNVKCEKDPEPRTAYPSAPQTGFPFRRPRACEARRNFNASRCDERVAGQTFESCLNQSLPVDLAGGVGSQSGSRLNPAWQLQVWGASSLRWRLRVGGKHSRLYLLQTTKLHHPLTSSVSNARCHGLEHVQLAGHYPQSRFGCKVTGCTSINCAGFAFIAS
jgi:hypothetical protein